MATIRKLIRINQENRSSLIQRKRWMIAAILVAAAVLASSVLTVQSLHAQVPANAENARLESQIESLAKNGDYAFERLDFDAVLEISEKLLALKSQRYGEGSSEVAAERRYITDVTLEQNVAKSNRIGLMELYRLHSYAKDASANQDYDRLLSIANSQVAKADELFGKEHTAAFRSRWWQLEALITLGRLDEALPVLRQELELCNRFFRPDDPRRIMTLGQLATAERAFGSMVEANKRLREAVDLLGPQEDQMSLSSIYQIRTEAARQHLALGKWDDAAEQWKAVVTACEKRGSDPAGRCAVSMTHLAGLELTRGRFADAYIYCRDARRFSQSNGGVTAKAAALAGSVALYSTIADWNNAKSAIDELNGILSECKTGIHGSYFDDAICKAGENWIAQRDFARALAEYQKVRELPSPFFSAEYLRGASWALTETKSFAEAEILLDRAPDETDANELPFDRAVHEFNTLVRANLRYRQGRKDEAIQLASKDLTAAYQLYGEDNPILLPYVQLRVDVLRGCGKESEAKALEGKVVRLKERQAAARKQIDELARSRR